MLTSGRGVWVGCILHYDGITFAGALEADFILTYAASERVLRTQSKYDGQVFYRERIWFELPRVTILETLSMSQESSWHQMVGDQTTEWALRRVWSGFG